MLVVICKVKHKTKSFISHINLCIIATGSPTGRLLVFVSVYFSEMCLSCVQETIPRLTHVSLSLYLQFVHNLTLFNTATSSPTTGTPSYNPTGITGKSGKEITRMPAGKSGATLRRTRDRRLKMVVLNV